MNKTIAGSTFGRWTVLDEFILSPKQERKWLCRCACGTTRYVLERALKYGNSSSCGCLRKENLEKANAHNLKGQQFGDLTVLGKDEKQHKNGGIHWICQCSCGNRYTVAGTLLVKGKRTHCGCKSVRESNRKDIMGRRFGKLTALYPTEYRDSKGSVVWHCRCDCGNELDVAYNVLLYTGQVSCGCQKKEHMQNLNKFLTHVDGTSMDMLQSKKIPINNTTGVRGVYLIRGKYVAKIVFQKKQYLLGSYESLEEAAEVRREAEEQLNDTVVFHYQKWKAKAAEDPVWAAENPVHIEVSKNGYGEITVNCFPEKIE